MFKKILIAEDQDDNRYFLKSALEQRSFQVVDAKNGKIALELFQKSDFDLVMTDIRMPEMDGLTLLRSIRQASPLTPVIIISAYGESENIIEALRNRACDYISKPYEQQEIFDSIDRVSRLFDSTAIKKEYAHSLTGETRQFEFSNDHAQTNSIARFLCCELDSYGLHAEKQSMQISLIEAIDNAILHGNLEISSSIKSSEDASSFKAFKELAEKRSRMNPYRSRRLTIDYLLDSEKICYTIKDGGAGFDYGALPDPLDPESFNRPSGRGLLMIRTFCDEVSWNDQGNEIKLVKYRENDPGISSSL